MKSQWNSTLDQRQHGVGISARNNRVAGRSIRGSERVTIGRPTYFSSVCPFHGATDAPGNFGERASKHFLPAAVCVIFGAR